MSPHLTWGFAFCGLGCGHEGFDVGVFGVVKPSESPIVAVFRVVKPSESPPAQVFPVVKPSESPSVLVFRAVKPSESPPFYVFPVVKPSESPPFYVFHPVIPSESPILTCGFVLCACLRLWPLPGDSPVGFRAVTGPFCGVPVSVGGGFGYRLLRGCRGVLGCGPGWGRLMSGLLSWVGWCRGCWWSVLWVGVGSLWWRLGGVGVGLSSCPGCLTNECSGVCH